MTHVTSVVQTMHNILGDVRREMANLRSLYGDTRGQVDSLLLKTDIGIIVRTCNLQELNNKVKLTTLCDEHFHSFTIIVHSDIVDRVVLGSVVNLLCTKRDTTVKISDALPILPEPTGVSLIHAVLCPF